MSIGLKADQQAIYLNDMYKAERESYKEEPTMYDKLFKVVQAKKLAGDKSTQLLGAGRLVRHTVENQDIVFKSPTEGWSFYVRYWTFSDGVVFSKEAVEDTNRQKVSNILKDYASTWGEQVRYEKETLAARVFNDGGDTSGDFVFNGSHTGNTDGSGDLAYDSFPYFNLTGNARSSKGGGTYFNAVSGLSLNSGDFETIYHLVTVTNAKNERDFERQITVDCLLTESGAQAFLANRLINTEKGYPNSQLNDLNPYFKIVTPVSWRFLNDNSAFYVGKKQHREFQWHERQMPEIRFFRDETNRSYKASIDVRFSPWLKNFRVWGRGGGTF